MRKQGFLTRVLEGIAALGILIFGLGAISTCAKADVMYIVNGSFDDGTTLTGSLLVNQYGFLSDWDLKTTNGTVGAYEYTPATTFTSDCDGICIFFGNRIGSARTDGGLQLTFANPLGSAGLDPIIGGAGGPSWQNLSFTALAPPIRFIEDGVAAAVPEASTWAMLLLGFLGIGVLAHRRKSSGAGTFRPA